MKFKVAVLVHRQVSDIRESVWGVLRPHKEDPELEAVRHCCPDCFAWLSEYGDWWPKWDWCKIGVSWDGRTNLEPLSDNELTTIRDAKSLREDDELSMGTTTVEMLVERLRDESVDFPSVVLTPGSTWHQPSHMIANQPENDRLDEWRSRALGILHKHKHFLAVSVLCHM